MDSLRAWSSRRTNILLIYRAKILELMIQGFNYSSWVAMRDNARVSVHLLVTAVNWDIAKGATEMKIPEIGTHFIIFFSKTGCRMDEVFSDYLI